MHDEAEEALKINKNDDKLANALSVIRILKNNSKKLESKVETFKDEKKHLKKNLVLLDRMKDELSIKYDEKLEVIASLEDEVREKTARIKDLEDTQKRIEQSLNMCQKINVQNEDNFKVVQCNIKQLEQEGAELKNRVGDLIKENKKLKTDFADIQNRYGSVHRDLHASKLEVKNLKLRLQAYVSEIRQFEDLIRMKENQRQSMLLQLKGDFKMGNNCFCDDDGDCLCQQSLPNKPRMSNMRQANNMCLSTQFGGMKRENVMMSTFQEDSNRNQAIDDCYFCTNDHQTPLQPIDEPTEILLGTQNYPEEDYDCNNVCKDFAQQFPLSNPCKSTESKQVSTSPQESAKEDMPKLGKTKARKNPINDIKSHSIFQYDVTW